MFSLKFQGNHTILHGFASYKGKDKIITKLSQR